MDDKLKDAIRQSGHRLHLEVAKYLEDLGWEVNISPHYCDDITNQSREVDIFAKKYVPIYDGNCPDEYKFYFCLVIDCKYFKEEVAFWISDNNTENAESAIKNQLNRLGVSELLSHQDLFTQHYYYRTDKVAKLFTVSYGNKGKTNTRMEKRLFNAITQPIKATIFFREEPRMKASMTIFYPLVVYNGIPGFYHIKDCEKLDNDNLDSLQPVANTLVNLRYSYRMPEMMSLPVNPFRTEIFYITFINKENFKKYLKVIEGEVNVVKFYLRRFFNEKRKK